MNESIRDVTVQLRGKKKKNRQTMQLKVIEPGETLRRNVNRAPASEPRAKLISVGKVT